MKLTCAWAQIEEEQRERDRRNKINAEFQGFVKRVQVRGVVRGGRGKGKQGSGGSRAGATVVCCCCGPFVSTRRLCVI